MVRARVLEDAGASKSTGNNRHKSPTPNTSSGRIHPPSPGPCPLSGLVSHQTHSEALPLRPVASERQARRSHLLSGAQLAGLLPVVTGRARMSANDENRCVLCRPV